MCILLLAWHLLRDILIAERRYLKQGESQKLPVKQESSTADAIYAGVAGDIFTKTDLSIASQNHIDPATSQAHHRRALFIKLARQVDMHAD